ARPWRSAGRDLAHVVEHAYPSADGGVVERSGVLPVPWRVRLLGDDARTGSDSVADHHAHEGAARRLQHGLHPELCAVGTRRVLPCIRAAAPSRFRLRRGDRLRVRTVPSLAHASSATALFVLDADWPGVAAPVSSERPPPLGPVVRGELAVA